MKSLRAELTRAALITTLVALLASAGAIAAFEFLRYRQQRGADLQARADVLAHAIAPALVFGDREGARRQLSALRNAPELQSAVVYQREGKTFAAFHASDRDREVAAVALRPEPRVSFGLSTVTLVQPIQHDDELVGHVFLSARHELLSRIAAYAALQAVVLAASLFGAAWLFRRLQSAAVQPLSDMTRVAQEVIDRTDWTLRAPPSRYEELTVLVTAFNRMLDEVGQRTAVLEAETMERQRVELELRAADEQKDVFLATLAHELRNPLAPMTVAVSILKKKQETDALRDKCVGILDRQLTHTVRLIDDLLDVSRIRVGKLTLKRETVELLSIIRAAVELIEPVAATKRQTIRPALTGPDIYVVADQTRLLQVFSNLLTNACRYTPNGGVVDVYYLLDAQQVRVSVKDTGVGVDASMQRKIFEMFQQADQSLERGSAGLGIGLTLASQLSQLHGGDITLHSEGLGRGSCFTVRLPVAAPGTTLASRGPVGETSPQRPLRILIADDNVDAAVGLQDAFEAVGHAVVVRHDGLAALEEALSNPFDAAILDIGMPGLNGYEVAERLRARRDESLTLIALTGWGQLADKQRATAAGFDHHFVKPAAPEELLASLARSEPSDFKQTPNP